MAEEKKTKKRQAKAGYKRVCVTVSDVDYQRIVNLAELQMREPNNLLSFLLKDRLEDMLKTFEEEL